MAPAVGGSAAQDEAGDANTEQEGGEEGPGGGAGGAGGKRKRGRPSVNGAKMTRLVIVFVHEGMRN
jgi:hypothetical protein